MGYKRLTCDVCGNDFYPRQEKRYTVKSKSLRDFNVVDRYYDAFDCPMCGCQIIAKERIVKEDEENMDEEIVNDEKSTRSRTIHIYDVPYRNRIEAEMALNRLWAIFDNYAMVSLGDYCDVLGFDRNKFGLSVCHTYGWIGMGGFKVVLRNNQYYLHIPDAIKLT